MNPSGPILPSSGHFLESPSCWNTQLRGSWGYADLTKHPLSPQHFSALQLHPRPRGLLRFFPSRWTVSIQNCSHTPYSRAGLSPAELSRLECGRLISQSLLRQIQHCPMPFFSFPLGFFSWLLLWCEREDAACHHWLLVNVS